MAEAASPEGAKLSSNAFWQLLMAAELSPDKSRTILKSSGSSAYATAEQFARHPLLTPAESARVAKCDVNALARGLDAGAELLFEEVFPAVLREAPGVPPVLALAGDKGALDAPTVGIVGTRNATTYGKAVARKFASALAKAGATIVSGGALGVDAAAHQGALEADGKTVAVLAGGLDRIYPAVHAGLFRRISASGCLISSYAFGVNPNPYKFLARNAIIAALSQVLLVVEAPEQSGSLSTAFAAADLNRQVFVVPANIDNLNFRGSHSLIREGATLTDHYDLILDTLQLNRDVRVEPRAEPSLLGRLILDALTSDPQTPDKLAEFLGLDSQSLLSELTVLELEGQVVRDSGGYARMP